MPKALNNKAQRRAAHAGAPSPYHPYAEGVPQPIRQPPHQLRRVRLDAPASRNTPHPSYAEGIKQQSPASRSARWVPSPYHPYAEGVPQPKRQGVSPAPPPSPAAVPGWPVLTPPPDRFVSNRRPDTKPQPTRGYLRAPPERMPPNLFQLCASIVNIGAGFGVSEEPVRPPTSASLPQRRPRLGIRARGVCPRGAQDAFQASQRQDSWGIAGFGRVRYVPARSFLLLPVTTVLQKLNNLPIKAFITLDLAFPNHENTPAEASQLSSDTRITTLIAVELLAPETDIGTRRRASFATTMPMPETTVNKDDSAPWSEDNIWVARQISPM